MIEPMPPRELLLASLDGEECDRVPVWLLFPYHPTGYYVDVRNHPLYRGIFEASKRYAVMLDRRNLSHPLFTPDVTVREESVTDGDAAVTRKIRLFRGERTVSEIRIGEAGTTVKKELDCEGDLDRFLSFPVETDERVIGEVLEGQLREYLREKDEFPTEYGAMMLDLGEPVNVLYQASNLEEFSIWSLTRSDDVAALLDRLMEQKRIVYRWCLERDLADVYFLVGSELAAPPLVSRETFRRWIVPYAKELIAMVHGYGKRVIQHFHGQIREILPDFLEMAPDGLHTIEAPPVGNCTMTEAFRRTNDQITLIGNIQYDDFRRFTPEQMRRAVRELVEECAGRRFILSPTAGPYEEEIPRGMIDNYMTFMEAAREYGRLS